MWKNQTNSRSFEQNLSRTRVEYDKPKWLLDESCMVELYTRIALIKGEIKK